MLVELNIENFAIIDKLHIRFKDGLNIITGETGAGKSIIFDALNMALGSRGSRDLIRDGKDSAFIEAIFEIDGSLREHIKSELDMEIDHLLILSRDIRRGSQSISKINGRTYPASEIKKITEYLVDIYGQHQHQLLLDQKNHLDMIDSFLSNEGKELKAIIEEEYSEYRRLLRLKNKDRLDDEELKDKIEYLKFQIKEIDEKELIGGEDEALEEEMMKLSNFKELSELMANIVTLLEGDTFEYKGLTDLFSSLNTMVGEASNLDGGLKTYKERISSLFYELEDIRSDVTRYYENMTFDEERFFEVKDRLDIINNMKMKYGKTLELIDEYRDKIGKELDELLTYNEKMERLDEEIELVRESILNKSKALSEIRKDISEKFSRDLEKELAELNMKDAKFNVSFEETDISSTGIDFVEFYIATNINQELKPLAKIVSGGEMSRIMLGVKSLSRSSDTETLIFDEIDTGVSGITAGVVGEKIKKLSEENQVIAVSHLPQIASLADNHFLIEKLTGESDVITNVREIGGEEKVFEIARLLGGTSDTSLKHAREMLKQSK